MRLLLLTAAVTLSFGAGQNPNKTSPLPMAEVEACRIEFTNAMAAAWWGGQIALYAVQTDDTGSVVRLERRVIEGREHLPPLVRLDQFEDCVRRWRFDGRGDFRVSLLGGTTFEGIWVIDVTQGSRVFRLRVAVARKDP